MYTTEKNDGYRIKVKKEGKASNGAESGIISDEDSKEKSVSIE